MSGGEERANERLLLVGFKNTKEKTMSSETYVKICDHVIEVSEYTLRCYEELDKLRHLSVAQLVEFDPKAKEEQHRRGNFYSGIRTDVERYIKKSSLTDEEHHLLVEHLSELELIDELLDQLDGR